MRDRKRKPTRDQLEGRIRDNESDMKNKEEKLERTATDVEIVRETYEDLELDGTVEGTDEIESNLDKAENVTVEVFDSKDAELDTTQNASTEYKNEIKERSDFSDQDLQKVSLSRSKLETIETIQELEKVKLAVIADIEFLQEKFLVAQKDIDESEEVQDSLIHRVHSPKTRSQ